MHRPALEAEKSPATRFGGISARFLFLRPEKIQTRRLVLVRDRHDQKTSRG